MRCAFPPYSLPAFLAPLVESLESADAFGLDARLRRALRIEQRLLAEMGPVLLEVARWRGYRAPDGLHFELPLVTYGPGERILR